MPLRLARRVSTRPLAESTQPASRRPLPKAMLDSAIVDAMAQHSAASLEVHTSATSKYHVHMRRETKHTAYRDDVYMSTNL